MSSEKPLVRVQDVHKYFTRGNERIDVLKGVNLDIPSGDFLALMGPSGSGKTTLLNLIGGLDSPTSGSVHVGGVDDQRARGRRPLALAVAAHRLRLPALQPAAGADGRAQRRAAVAPDVALEGRASQARRDRAEGRGAGRARAALSAPALRRPGTARRHRPRDRHGSHAAALRRADGRPRPQGRRRDSRPAADAQPGTRQDDRDGDARPACGRAGAADTAPRQGLAATEPRA